MNTATVNQHFNAPRRAFNIRLTWFHFETWKLEGVTVCWWLSAVVMETAVVIPVLVRALCFVNIDTPVCVLLSACQQLPILRDRQNL